MILPIILDIPTGRCIIYLVSVPAALGGWFLCRVGRVPASASNFFYIILKLGVDVTSGQV